VVAQRSPDVYETRGDSDLWDFKHDDFRPIIAARNQRTKLDTEPHR